MKPNLHFTIIGSGISGISLAKILNDRSIDVEIFEKENNIGGLIKCENIRGYLFHKVGGHVFNSKNLDVLNWFWKYFDKENEFVEATRNAKILIDERYIGYPIENYLYQLDQNQVKSIVTELLELHTQNQQSWESESFESFLVKNFGKTLYEIYFKPYNSKLWNTDLSEVPLDWLDGKLPMPNIYTILLNNIFRTPESNMVHSKFWYPKSGGSQFIIDRLSSNLLIHKGVKIFSIEFSDSMLVINRKILTNKLIFTGNVKDLVDLIKIEDDALNAALTKVLSLKSNGTSNVLCETDKTDLSWLYLPEKKYKSHRIIFTGNFSVNNNPQNNRNSCVVEFSGKYSFEEINKELSELPGNLKPIAYNYEPHSYVIQNENTRKIINDLKSHLSKYQIYLHGRFAEWEYYNMDICIQKSIELSKMILDE